MHGGPQDRPVGVPTSPTGRVPQWVLDELTGGTTDPPGWRAWAPSRPPRRRRPAIRGLLSLVVVLALGLGAGVLLDGSPWPGPASGGGGAGDRPTPGREAAAGPLGQPGAAPATGSHAFTAVQDDGVTPVTYDPCRPLHHVLAPAGAPEGAEALVAEAVARVSAASGLRFVDDGTTDETWSDQRPAYQPDRYGDRWAPVLVSWAAPEQVPALAGTVAGIGGSQAVSAGGPLVYVTGAVTVDAGWATDVLGSPGGRDAVLAVLVHELGHVLGLDHVADPAELMSATNEGQVDLGPGDRAGLARLGRGPCEPRL